MVNDGKNVFGCDVFLLVLKEIVFFASARQHKIYRLRATAITLERILTSSLCFARFFTTGEKDEHRWGGFFLKPILQALQKSLLYPLHPWFVFSLLRVARFVRCWWHLDPTVDSQSNCDRPNHKEHKNTQSSFDGSFHKGSSCRVARGVLAFYLCVF